MTTTTQKSPEFRFRTPLFLAAGAAIAAVGAGALYFRAQTPPVASKTMPIVAPITAVRPVSVPLSTPPASAFKTTNIAAPIQAAYRAGDYAKVEVEAQKTLVAVTAHSPVTERRVAVQVRKVQAFAAARRKDLGLARERFALLRQEAARLPDHGAVQVTPGEGPHATLEEDAAYQHAVCTTALGDKAAGEAEYLAFIRAYPESPLVSGCIKRIMRMHGGDIPKEAGAVWRGAMKTAQARGAERERQASLCGPESLAYLLADGSVPGAAHLASLAKEMHTDQFGTSIGAVEEAARRHGYLKAQAAQMTPEGLRNQLSKGPVIALLMTEHFVTVLRVNESGVVTAWDANAKGLHQPGERTFLASEWEQAWQDGYAVALGSRSGK